jgi:CrcB protein
MRYLIGMSIQQRAGVTFPLGTLAINIAGSFLLGFLLRATFGSTTLSPEKRAFLATGFCGGFTTFSTFSFDTAGMIEDGSYGRAAAYVGLSVGVSLIATFAGFALAQSALSLRGRS